MIKKIVLGLFAVLGLILSFGSEGAYGSRWDYWMRKNLN